ncbi:MAG: triose-phosphate isomerase [bacterium]
MKRTPLVVGNWKMHKTGTEAIRLIEDLRKSSLPSNVEVAVCPAFTALSDAGSALRDSPIRLGAQDMYWEAQGAFTGEVSPLMLAAAGCRYVIVGHSERRQFFGETDVWVTRKVQAAFAHGLVPILCVGERLEERDAGRTDRIVTEQTEVATGELNSDQVVNLVVAYEPVWAIGTGRSATGEEANRVTGLIRRVLGRRSGGASAQTRILYGGSVTPDNGAEFFGQPEIDGGLIGGASLDAGKFTAIVRAASRERGNL